ncbi:MAG: metal ABC transporter permease [Planctomycetota bacterium]
MRALLDLLGDLDGGTVWTVVVGMSAATSCALVGSYLVLRRIALLGDAISHAVLPGLVIGFMLSGSRSLLPMLGGAVVAALSTTYLTETIARRGRVAGDASMGVVFTTLFAIGVILMSRHAAQVDLDPGCVLYGQLELAAIDTVSIAVTGSEVPRTQITLTLILLANLLLLSLFWKELKITSFDPALAVTVGISATAMHYLLMTMVAATAVACFEAVGSILVIAMLIVPAATARLLTDRLATLLVAAVLVAWISAIGGYALAVHLDTSVAGMMAVVVGGEFALAALLAPRHGILAGTLRRAALALRIAEDDVLAALYRLQEAQEPQIAAESAIPGAPEAPPARRLPRLALRIKGLLRGGPPGAEKLTSRGLARGRALVRAHRTWEVYLRERLDLPADHLHDPANRMEHYVDDSMAERILEGLEQPQKDPHGRRIPPKED